MRNPLHLLIGLGLTGAVLVAGASLASERIATDTGKQCTSCHDKPGSKLLTDSGKYFESLRTLEGFDAVKDSFGRCTSCHDRKPGSRKLTRQGRQFAGLVKDMPGLNQWMRESHPKPAAR